MDELNSTVGIVALAAAGVALVALVLCATMAMRLRRIRREQRAVLGDTLAADWLRTDLDALTPPNLSTLGSTTTAVPGQPPKNGAAVGEPVPPPLDFGKLDSPKLGGAENSPSASTEFGLPPELEGSSVPLPSASSSSTFTSTVPKSADPNPLTLPGFPGLDAGAADASRSQSGTLATPVSTSNSAIQGDLQAAARSEIANKNEPPKTEASRPGSGKPNQPFKTAREEALKLAGEGKLREALAKMSAYYNHIDLTREEELDLIDLLDALAGEVIYSKRHLLESPFIVSPGETLESIAARFRIAPETLAKINMMADSKFVLAGSQLKVINGPMRADVNLTRGELTLFLNELYAGRFPISVGNDPAPLEGTYEIIDRRRDRTYYGANSQVLPATDGRNPYVKAGPHMHHHH